MRTRGWAPACLFLVACQNIVGVRDGTLREPEDPAGSAGASAGSAGAAVGGTGALAGRSGSPSSGGFGASSGGSGDGGAAGSAVSNGGKGGDGGAPAGGQGGEAGAGGETGGGASGAGSTGAGSAGASGAGSAGASGAGSAGTTGTGGSGPVIPGGAPPIGWVRRYGTLSDETVTVGASDGAHGVILAGRLTSTMTFAPGFVVPVKGIETRYFLRVDETGSVVWVRSFTAQAVTLSALVGLPDGGALVAASIEGKLVPAAGDTTADYVAPSTQTGRTPTLLRLAPDGRLRWARRFATTLGDGTAVIRTAAGVFFAGTFVGSCDLGNGKILLGKPNEPDASDLFVAKIDEATGATVDGHAFVGAASTGLPALVARSTGAAALLPCAQPFSVDAAGEPIACAGLTFVPLDAATANPDVSAAKALVIPNAATVRAARAPDGDLYLASRFEGTADVAGLPIASGGPARTLFVRLNDAGVPQAAAGLGGPGTHVVNALVPDAIEGVVFAGSAKGATSYEGGSVTATPAGQPNAFLGRLRPSLTIAWLGLAPGVGAPLSQAANVLVSDELSVYAGASLSGTFFIDGPLTSLGQRDIVLMRLLR